MADTETQEFIIIVGEAARIRRGRSALFACRTAKGSATPFGRRVAPVCAVAATSKRLALERVTRP